MQTLGSKACKLVGRCNCRDPPRRCKTGTMEMSSSKDISEEPLLKQVLEVVEMVQTVSLEMKIGINSLFCLHSKEMGGALSTLQSLDAKDEKQETFKSKAEGSVKAEVLCG